MDTTAWRQERITLYGRAMPVPRLTAWYGDKGYRYSGIDHPPQAWTKSLALIKARVESACGASFNTALVNLYRTGADSVSWHSDDEKELGPEPVIASVSFGATRRFQLKSRRGPERVSLDLEPGSLLIMRGTLQRDWAHQVPKTKRPVGPRVNVTFREVA